MSPDLETLRAYADGELPAQLRQALEVVIAADPALAAQVEALFASRLPYQSAFSQEPLADVPPALQAHVAELAAVATASHEVALAGAPGRMPQQPGRSPWMWPALMLVSLALVYAAATHHRRGLAVDIEPWVQKVSSYHSMYARETVTDGGPTPAQTQALQRRLRQQGLELQIPDLSAQGLRFFRAQQLQLEGRMVLQLVYLPEQGLPVALCLTSMPAQQERSVAVEGLQALTWHAKGWAYLLVGNLPAAQMEKIRRAVPAALI